MARWIALFANQRVLNNHILGEDSDPLPDDVDSHGGHVNQKGFRWFCDNKRPSDAKEMDRVYHSEARILRGNEHVEMAFKGWRDATIFPISLLSHH
jgi:hypothetical protein